MYQIPESEISGGQTKEGTSEAKMDQPQRERAKIRTVEGDRSHLKNQFGQKQDGSRNQMSQSQIHENQSMERSNIQKRLGQKVTRKERKKEEEEEEEEDDDDDDDERKRRTQEAENPIQSN